MRANKFSSLMALLAATLVLIFGTISVRAASAYAGFYTGYVYSSISGTITVPESAIGVASFTVDDNGNITGNITGTVNGSGNITWNQNDTGFTTGTISGGVLASTTSQNNGGAITTFRIAANNTAGGFGNGAGTVAGNLIWRSPTPSGSTSGQNLMYGVTYGGGKYVAVGTAGNVAISGNGTNWISGTIGANLQLNAVAYGNNVFVAGGNSASIFTSPDGITWTPRNLTADIVKYDVKGVAYGSSQFVVVNLINEIFTSTDGTSWTKIGTAPSTSGNWNNLKYVGGIFVLVGTSGSNGTISTSTDGVTWSATKTVTSSSGILDVAYGNGTWVGVNVSKVITFTATDASDATFTSFSGLGDSVGFINGLFVSDNRYFSADGVTWSRESYPNLDINDIVTGNGIMVAVGAGITTTVDGKIWTVHTKVLPLATVNNVGYNGIVTGDIYDEIQYYNYQGANRFLRMGVGGLIDEKVFGGTYTNLPSPTANTLRAGWAVGSSAAVAVGDNGTVVRYGNGPNAWTNVTSVTSANLNSVSGNGNTLVAVGAGGVIIRSTDAGQTWGTVSSGTANTLNRVAFLTGTGFNYFMAVGNNGTILKSTDGSSWSVLTTGSTKRLIGLANRTVPIARNQAVADDSTVLISENHGTSWRSITVNAPYAITWADANNARGVGGFLMTTSEGTNWSYSLPLNGVVSLANGNGKFVAVCSQAIISSTDLDNWTAVGLPYSHVPSGASYANGMFFSLGTGDTTTGKGFIATSTDGLKWNTRTVATTSQLESAAYGNGRYVAVGAVGTIFSSTDTVTWVNRTITGSQNLHSIAYGGGMFVAVGDTGNTRYSTDGENWTASTANTGNSLLSITYGKGIFVAVGNSGTIRTSSNGTTWTTRSSSPSTTRGFKSVSFTGNMFIIVGDQDGSNGAVVISSTDGVTWTKDVSNFALGLTTSTAGNGSFVAAGGNNAVVSAAYQSAVTPPAITGQPSPGSQTVSAGANVTYTATVTGSGLTYQWFKDGTPLADGTGVSGSATATLTLTGVDVLDTGTYQLAVYNAGGSALTSALTLNVNGPPIITANPVSATISNTLTTNFTVTAVGPGTLTYVWRKNTAPLSDSGHYSGTGTSKLTIASASGADEATYDVIVSNGFGSSSPSTGATLTVNRPPTITTPPVAVSINQGQTINLSVVADGSPTLTYVWKHDGVTVNDGGRISGATTANLVINSAVVADHGGYTVTVTGPYSPAATSTSVYVSVLGPGALLPTFGFNGTAQIYDIAPTADGKFIIAGDFSITSGFTWSKLAKIDSNGVPVSTFATTNSTRIANSTVQTIAVQPDGQLLVGGSFWQWGGSSSYGYAVRLSADGVLDTTYTPNPNAIVPKIIALANGKSLIARTGLGAGAQSYLAQYTSTGSKDTANFTELFTSTMGQINSMVRQTDGKVWLGMLAGAKRVNADGSSPTVFGSSVGYVHVGPDDKIYYTDNSGFFLKRLNTDGSADSTFTLSLDGQVLDMAFLANGNIVIVGSFHTLNTTTTSAYIAVVDNTGTVVSSFSSPYTWAFGGALNTIEMLGDGSALVGGNINLTLPSVQRYLQRVQIGDLPVTGITFAEWVADKGLNTGVNDGLNDDADNDGYKNVVEYVFATDPSQSGSKPLIEKIKENFGGTDYPAVRAIALKDLLDIDVIVEASTDILFSSTIPTVVTKVDQGNGTEQITVRTTTPFSSTTKVFFRFIIKDQIVGP